MVTINFIRDKEVGMFARAKRLGKGAPLGGKTGKVVNEDADEGESDKSE